MPKKSDIKCNTVSKTSQLYEFVIFIPIIKVCYLIKINDILHVRYLFSYRNIYHVVTGHC